MPALPPVPNVIKLILTQTLDADTDVVNIAHFGYTGTAPSDAQMAAACSTVGSYWTTDVAPNLSNALKLTTVTLVDLSSSTAGFGEQSSTATGGGSCTPEVAEAAVCISRKVQRRYRGGHSRIYLAGMCEGHRSTTQLWDPAQLEIWREAWEDFEGDVQAALVSSAGVSTAYAVNVSYYHGFTNFLEPSGRYRAIPTLRATPLVDTVIAYVGNPKVASQRRRSLQSA